MPTSRSTPATVPRAWVGRELTTGLTVAALTRPFALGLVLGPGAAFAALIVGDG